MTELVSAVTGIRQAAALRLATRSAFALAVIGVLGLGSVSTVAAAASLTIIVAAPLLRVAWLIVRWAQEGDRRFAGLGAVLLLLGAAGAIITRVLLA